MTRETSEYYSELAELGCIICQMPAEIHHLTGAGMALKSKNAIPLCPRHHRTGGYGVAIHAGEKKWEENFGTQEELLEKTKELVSDTE